MSIPSLNHISTIQCSQVRKRYRNASIIHISSLSTQQTRNQLGTQGWAKSFPRGDQIFWTMSNSFKLCPIHFSRGAKNILGGFAPPRHPLVTGLLPVKFRLWKHHLGLFNQTDSSCGVREYQRCVVQVQVDLRRFLRRQTNTGPVTATANIWPILQLNHHKRCSMAGKQTGCCNVVAIFILNGSHFSCKKKNGNWFWL